MLESEKFKKQYIIGEFETALADKFAEAQALLLKKHNDYGPKNISQSPGGPLNGLRVRTWDKLARINNLIDSGVTPENESLRDSFIDMANYAIIGLMVIDGDWDKDALVYGEDTDDITLGECFDAIKAAEKEAAEKAKATARQGGLFQEDKTNQHKAVGRRALTS